MISNKIKDINSMSCVNPKVCLYVYFFIIKNIIDSIVHVHFSTQILNQTHILCIRNKNYVEEKMKWTIFAYPLISICANT